MNGKISIIMPVYNVEKYINQCVDSILEQSYTNFEIIAVNDGSTDRSGDILDEYSKTDNRIKVIHQENKGAAVAKNTALKNITGDFFVFIDSDDYVDPGILQELIDIFQKYDVDVIEFGYFNTYKTKEETNFNTSRIIKYDRLSFFKRFTYDWNVGLLWNKIYKRKIGEGVFFKNERRCIDDQFFNYKALLNIASAVVYDKAFYHYRQRRSSVMNSDKLAVQRSIDNMDFSKERYEAIKKHMPELKKDFCINLLDMSYYILNELYVNEEVIYYLKKFMRYTFFECLKNGLINISIMRLFWYSLIGDNWLSSRDIYKNKNAIDYSEYFD